ncbi:MAG: hypothetical protein ABI882_01830, partial [Acidobacteriota bacterium]
LIAANPGLTPRIGTLTIAGKTVTVTQAASTQYQVSGKVNSVGGAPMVMVTVSFSRSAGNGGIPLPVLTDAVGNWSQSGFDAGSTYRVIVVQARTSFAPRTREFSGPTSALNFETINRAVTAYGHFLPAPQNPLPPPLRRLR